MTTQSGTSQARASAQARSSTKAGTSKKTATPAKAKPSRRTKPSTRTTPPGAVPSLEAGTVSASGLHGPGLHDTAPHDTDTHDPGTQDHHAPPPVPADPEGVVIEIPVIATRLSRMPRWCGGGVHPCSVAEHSVLVTKIMEHALIEEGADPETPFISRALLFGLLHDAHEAFTGDMTRQVQGWYAAELPGFTAARERLNASWDRVILKAAGLGEPEALIVTAIGHADEMAGKIEREVLFDGEAGGGVVHGWPPEQAYHAFMKLYGQLHGRLQANLQKEEATQ